LQRLNAKIATVNMAPSHGRVTVTAFLSDWLAHKRVHVRASTLRAYEQDVRLHIKPKLGALPLDRLQARDAQLVIDDLAKAGKWNMADRVRRTLKTALNAAVKWGYITVNVMNQVDAVRKPAPKRGAYTLEQVQTFLQAAGTSTYYPLFALAFAAGMRKGELLALQWRDVSSVGVHVRRTVSINAPGDGTTPPKTNAGFRFIPVHEDVMQLVLARRSRMREMRIGCSRHATRSACPAGT
jgi:Site-specific recombinase XerD